MLRRFALVTLVAVVGASSATAATPKKFGPAVLAGTWAGTWTNHPSAAFGTSSSRSSG